MHRYIGTHQQTHTHRNTQIHRNRDRDIYKQDQKYTEIQQTHRNRDTEKHTYQLKHAYRNTQTGTQTGTHIHMPRDRHICTQKYSDTTEKYTITYPVLQTDVPGTDTPSQSHTVARRIR